EKSISSRKSHDTGASYESVPGISRSERENGKKGTTLSSRELHDKELV
nr:hypothetical protein [Tanacetum cinerariifolium]